MAIGVEINGGGNNKVSKSSFHLTGDSKAVVINESEGNEISEIFAVVRENIEKLEQGTYASAKSSPSCRNHRDIRTFGTLGRELTWG